MGTKIAGSRQIKMMFSQIASNYDKVNRVISLGADMGWRHEAAKDCMVNRRSIRVLDVATGTGDLAIAIVDEARRRKKKASVAGLDFNEDMLKIAKKKIERRNMRSIELLTGDALSLQLKSGSFDVVTSGFALRNFDDLSQFIRESYRVLTPGGRIVFLDVSKPSNAFDSIFKFYYKTVIPMIGAKYNKDAYLYLVSSMMKFDKARLIDMTKSAGFRKVRLRNLTLGAAFILTGEKPRVRRARASD